MRLHFFHWRRSLVLVLFVLAVLVPTQLALANNPNPGVLPPSSSPHGKTYGEWSAVWWQWFLRFPAPGPGEPCDVGQQGSVWFLAGAPVALGDPGITRTCVIPAGKTLFFPVINAEWSVAEGPCPFLDVDTTTEAGLRACTVAVADHITVVEASVDGIPLQNLAPPASPYRVQSPLFTFDAVVGNGVVPPGVSNAVADGYWIMLAPLSAGQHTLYFKGVAPFPEFGFTFVTDVTYHLTIAPGN